MKILQDNLTNIKNNIMVGNRKIILKKWNKLFLRILDTMIEGGYIESYVKVPYETSKKNVFHYIEVKATTKLTKCSAVTPSMSIKSRNILKTEQRFLPSIRTGLLIFSTSQGILTNKDLTEKNLTIGGKILAYVY